MIWLKIHRVNCFLYHNLISKKYKISNLNQSWSFLKLTLTKKKSKILTLIKQTFDSFYLNVSNILFDQIQAMFSLKRPATFELLVLYFLFEKKYYWSVFVFNILQWLWYIHKIFYVFYYMFVLTCPFLEVTLVNLLQKAFSTNNCMFEIFIFRFFLYTMNWLHSELYSHI